MSFLIALAPDGKPSGCPMLAENVCQIDPQVAALSVLTAAELAPLGYAPYEVTERPPVPEGGTLSEGVAVLDAAGVWRQAWVVTSPGIDVLKRQAIAQIDAEVDAFYAAVVGNRAAEYEAAERQARAYEDANFSGPVPSMVGSWAVAKGWTDQVAAQDILAQSSAWRGAQNAIRAHRLLAKEQARIATDAVAVGQALAGWSTFHSAARAQLGV